MAYSRVALLDSVNNEITPYVDIEGIYLSEDYLTKKTASILVGIDTSVGEDVKAASVAVITGFEADPNDKHKIRAIKQNISTSSILSGDDAGAEPGTYLQYDGDGKYSWVPGDAIEGAQGVQGPRGFQGTTGDSWFSSGTGSATSAGNIGTSYTVYAPAFYEASDANLKTNVEPIEESIIEEIFNHEPELIKRFQWIDSGEFSYGVIAQEIQKFAPELVAECDGHLKVNYDATLAMLVGALIRRVKNLESKFNMLQAYH